MTAVFSQGEATFTVPDAEKVAIYSDSPVKLYEQVGYPNFPATWNLLYTTTAGETYTSAAFSGATVCKIEASEALAYYEVGAAPVIGDPTADLSAADATFTIQGLAAAQGGYVYVVGGTSSTAGNAGGEVRLLGGQPGATGVGGIATLWGGAGGSTSGKGGAARMIGGAGTAGNASGGSVFLLPGAAHGSGLAGGSFVRSNRRFVTTPTPETATDTTSLTDAQMLSGILVCTPTAAAAYTVRTGTQLKAALPTDLTGDDAFDLTIINIGGTGDDITLTANTDITIVGDAVVRPSADSGTEQAGQGTFRFRFVSGTTFVAYRIS